MLRGRHSSASGGTALRVLLGGALAVLAWFLLATVLGTAAAHAEEGTGTAEATAAVSETAATSGSAVAETPAEASPGSSTTDASAGSAGDGSAADSDPAGDSAGDSAGYSAGESSAGDSTPAEARSDGDAAEKPESAPSDAAETAAVGDEPPADNPSPTTESDRPAKGALPPAESTGLSSGGTEATAGKKSSTGADRSATGSATGRGSWLPVRSDAWIATETGDADGFGAWLHDTTSPRSDHDARSSATGTDPTAGEERAVRRSWRGAGRSADSGDTPQGSADEDAGHRDAGGAGSVATSRPAAGTSSGTNGDRVPWPRFPHHNGTTANLAGCSPGFAAEAGGAANYGIALSVWIGGRWCAEIVPPLNHVPVVKDPSCIGDPRGPPAGRPNVDHLTLRHLWPGAAAADCASQVASPIDIPTDYGGDNAPPAGTAEPGPAVNGGSGDGDDAAPPVDATADSADTSEQPTDLGTGSPSPLSMTRTIRDVIVAGPRTLPAPSAGSSVDNAWGVAPPPIPAVPATPADPSDDTDPRPSAPVPGTAPSTGTTATIGPGNGGSSDNNQMPMALSSAPIASLGLYLIGIGLGVAAFVVLAQLPPRRRRRTGRLS